jgi:hypothetical protein
MPAFGSTAFCLIWDDSRSGSTLRIGQRVACCPQQREERSREEMLREIWNLGGGGPLYYTKQASQHSILCTAIRCSTEYTVLAGLICTQRTTFSSVSNPSQPAQADGEQGHLCVKSLGSPLWMTKARFKRGALREGPPCRIHPPILIHNNPSHSSPGTHPLPYLIIASRVLLSFIEPGLTNPCGV